MDSVGLNGSKVGHDGIDVNSNKVEVDLNGSKVGLDRVDIDSEESEVNADPGEVEVAVDKLEVDPSNELESDLEFEETGVDFLVRDLNVDSPDIRGRGVAASLGALDL